MTAAQRLALTIKARRGGSSRSWKKQRAARENGRLGGRPRKTQAK